MTERIAVAAFFQETNSFSPRKTDLDALSSGGLLTGESARQKFAGTETEIGGALDVLDDGRVETYFLPSLWLMPAGPLTPEALARFAAEFEGALRRLPDPPSAVCVSVHGALAAENVPDATGWFLEWVRKLVPGIPIVASADFHANVTERMTRNADLIVGYRTYPHTDLRETGRRAAKCLKRIVCEHERPRTVRARLPMIVPTETSQHTAPPVSRVLEQLAKVEGSTGWPASCFCPHPWLNVPDFSVVLLAYADQAGTAEAQRRLTEAAREMWDARELLYRPMPDLPATWRQMEQSGQRPVILVDSGDVVLAGAPGDSTAVIRFLDSLDTALKCLLHVTAPRALSLLWEAPRGRETQCTIEPAFGEPSRLPLILSCRVQTRSEAGYTSSGDYLGGVRIDPGRRLVLRWKGHTLVLAERPDPAHDPEFFRSLEIEPREYDVIVVKSHNTFRPAYRSITETIMRAATPGATNPDLFALPYSSDMRGLYPFSEAALPSVSMRPRVDETEGHEEHGGGRS